MTTATRKPAADVARDVLEVFASFHASKLAWPQVLAGLIARDRATYAEWSPERVHAALAPLGVPSVSLKTDHTRPGSVKGIRQVDVEAALAPPLFTPTAEQPLAGHVLRATITETSTLYKDRAETNCELTISIECQMPATAGHECTAEDEDYCEASEFIGEDDVANYRGPSPIDLRPGAEVVVWREAVQPVQGCAPYLWRWRYAEDA